MTSLNRLMIPQPSPMIHSPEVNLGIRENNIQYRTNQQLSLLSLLFIRSPTRDACPRVIAGTRVTGVKREILGLGTSGRSFAGETGGNSRYCRHSLFSLSEVERTPLMLAFVALPLWVVTRDDAPAKYNAAGFEFALQLLVESRKSVHDRGHCR